jgi:hypothetical protein
MHGARAGWRMDELVQLWRLKHGPRGCEGLLHAGLDHTTAQGCREGTSQRGAARTLPKQRRAYSVARKPRAALNIGGGFRGGSAEPAWVSQTLWSVNRAVGRSKFGAREAPTVVWIRAHGADGVHIVRSQGPLAKRRATAAGSAPRTSHVLRVLVPRRGGAHPGTVRVCLGPAWLGPCIPRVPPPRAAAECAGRMGCGSG